MENRIQVLKGPFNILQLAPDKRSQFPSPGLFTFNNTKSHKELLKNRTPDCKCSDISLLRHNRHGFCRCAELPVRQDRAALPWLLCDRAKQLFRNRRLWPPAQPQHGTVQPQHPVPHAPRLHLLRELQGWFPGGVCFDPPHSKPP